MTRKRRKISSEVPDSAALSSEDFETASEVDTSLGTAPESEMSLASTFGVAIDDLDDLDNHRGIHSNADYSNAAGTATSHIADDVVTSPQSSSPANFQTESVPGSPSVTRGRITLIRLRDFVTYSHAEFMPGPRLNMIIGPNGSGKSSLVCAIAIGLGASPSVLGRAKEATEYIKHGCDEAEIEITLNDTPKQHCITRRIYRNRPSCWFVNSEPSGIVAVRKLVDKLGIQVDNLCQFLPQDRVGSFSTMSADTLLLETERAIGNGELLKAHSKLTEWDSELERVNKELRTLETELKILETRQNEAESEIEVFRQREVIRERLEMLRAKLPVLQYKNARDMVQSKKNEFQEVRKAIKQLETKITPILQRKERLRVESECLRQVRRENIEEAEHCRDGLINCGSQIEKLRSDRATLAHRREHLQSRLEEKSQRIDSLRKEISQMERSIGSEPEKPDFQLVNKKLADLEERITQIQIQQETKEDEMQEHKRELASITNDAKRLKAQIDELNSLEGVRKNLLKVNNRADSLVAHDWLIKNRNLFKNDVFGPAFLYLSISRQDIIPALESCLRADHYTAFTFLNRQDYELFMHKIVDTEEAVGRRLRVFAVEWSNTSAPTVEKHHRASLSRDALQSLGFDGYALDFFRGPKPVLNTLCHIANIHQIPISLNDLNENSLSNIEKLLSNNGPCIRRFISGQFNVSMYRSKYGQKLVSSSWMPIRRGPRWFRDNLAGSADHEVEAEYNTVLGDLKKVEELISLCQSELNTSKAQQEHENSRKRDLRNERQEMQKERLEWERLNESLARRKREIKKLFTKRSEDAEALRSLEYENRQFIHQIYEQSLLIPNLVKQYAESVRTSASSQLKVIQSETDERHFASLNSRTESQLKELRQIAEVLKEDLEKLKSEAKEKLKVVEQLLIKLDIPKKQELQREIASSGTQQVEDLERQIDQEQAQFDLLYASAGVLEQYEQRKARMENAQAAMAVKQRRSEELQSFIADTRITWEPKLEECVNSISESFANLFESIGCVGMVGLGRSERFNDWALEVKVKFRDNERLQLLDGQRQSGGERAVSTILFLLALQSVAPAPFRVVDEINQGMDPRNERMIHERLVHTACAESKSQYFLITPKLLPDLFFHENMTVHCIFNGAGLENMPPKYQI